MLVISYLVFPAVSKSAFLISDSQMPIYIPCYPSERVVVENSSDTLSDIYAILEFFYSCVNHNNQIETTPIQAGALSQGFNASERITQGSYNDSLGDKGLALVTTKPVSKLIILNTPGMTVKIPAQSNYTLELVINSSQIYLFSQGLLDIFSYTLSPPTSESLTIVLDPRYTVINQTESGVKSTEANKLVWNLIGNVRNNIFVKFVPFRAQSKLESSWTYLLDISGISVNAHINELYPNVSIAYITYSLFLSIPQVRNGIKLSPDQPIFVPLPASYYNGTASDIHDKNGTLSPAPNGFTGNASKDLGHYYITGPGGAIITYPRHDSYNGQYFYNVTATYATGITGALTYEDPFSINESFFVFSNFGGGDVNLTNPVLITFTISVPNEVMFVKEVDNATNATKLVINSQTKEWVVQQPAGYYENIQFTFLYYVNSVERIWDSGNNEIYLAIAGLVLVLVGQVLLRRRKFVEKILTAGFIPLVLALFIPYNTDFEEFIRISGPFTSEIVNQRNEVIILYALAGIVWGLGSFRTEIRWYIVKLKRSLVALAKSINKHLKPRKQKPLIAPYTPKKLQKRDPHGHDSQHFCFFLDSKTFKLL